MGAMVATAMLMSRRSAARRVEALPLQAKYGNSYGAVAAPAPGKETLLA